MLKSSFLFILSLLFVTQTVVGQWDFAVSTSDEILFFDANWNQVADSGNDFNGANAIAFDEVQEQIFFSDRNHKDGILFLLKLDPLKNNKPSINTLVHRRTEDDAEIAGIAYDPLSRTLFWTNRKHKIIYSLVLDGSQNKPKKLKEFSDGKIQPYALAIDVCRQKLYWTNMNSSRATIRRMSLDGSNDEEIIGENLEFTTSIFVDQFTERIYFTANHPGTGFSVQSSKLNGTDRHLILEDYNHIPVGIAVTDDSIIWVDSTQDTVWKVPKSNSTWKEKPIPLKSFGNTCYGIVFRQHFMHKFKKIEACRTTIDQIESNHDSYTNTPPVADYQRKAAEKNNTLYCLGNGNYTGTLPKLCMCKPGFTGSRCETNVCHNFCDNGKCDIVHGSAVCTCAPGYSGTRCQTWDCHNYCLNGGVCQIYNGNTTCSCMAGFKGTRCELNSTKTETCQPPCILPSMITEAQCSNVCEKSVTMTPESLDIDKQSQSIECPTTWNKTIIVIVLGVVVSLGIAYLIIVALKHFYKPARPRIRKTFVVRQKNSATPLTSRPIADEECQITIENCCNMNICDTPCFDPKLLQQNMESKSRGSHRSKKEDKDVLIPDID